MILLIVIYIYITFFLNKKYKFSILITFCRGYTLDTSLKVNIGREKMFASFKCKCLTRNSEKQIHTKFLFISAN